MGAGYLLESFDDTTNTIRTIWWFHFNIQVWNTVRPWIVALIGLQAALIIIFGSYQGLKYCVLGAYKSCISIIGLRICSWSADMGQYIMVCSTMYHHRGLYVLWYVQFFKPWFLWVFIWSGQFCLYYCQFLDLAFSLPIIYIFGLINNFLFPIFYIFGIINLILADLS